LEAKSRTKKATQKTLDGWYNLGVDYDRDGDFEKAVIMYRKAAEAGDKDAQFCLACSYHRGQGVAKDEEAAVLWYRKAAAQGDADAQFWLALCYNNGTGVAMNKATACELLRGVIKLGKRRFFPALICLARSLARAGPKGVELCALLGPYLWCLRIIGRTCHALELH
jgi:TPR repeat protein